MKNRIEIIIADNGWFYYKKSLNIGTDVCLIFTKIDALIRWTIRDLGGFGTSDVPEWFKLLRESTHENTDS